MYITYSWWLEIRNWCVHVLLKWQVKVYTSSWKWSRIFFRIGVNGLRIELHKRFQRCTVITRDMLFEIWNLQEIFSRRIYFPIKNELKNLRRVIFRPKMSWKISKIHFLKFFMKIFKCLLTQNSGHNFHIEQKISFAQHFRWTSYRAIKWATLEKYFC